MKNVAYSIWTQWLVVFLAIWMIGILVPAWMGRDPEKLRLQEIETKRAAVPGRQKVFTEALNATNPSSVTDPTFPMTADEFRARIKDRKLAYDTYTEFLPVSEHQKLMRYFLEQHPIASLDDRLAYEDNATRLSQHRKRHRYSLASMTRVLHDEWNAAYRREDVPPDYRMEYPIKHKREISLSVGEQALRELHRNREDAFALQASNFGVDRMPPISVHSLYPSDFQPPVVPLPEAIPEPSPEVSTYIERYRIDLAEQEVFKIDAERNEAVRKDFVKYFHKAAIFRFGSHNEYVPKHRQAVGFRYHYIQSMNSWTVFQVFYAPRRPEWILTRLELVSMLKFDDYRVYVSEHLPNMKNLQEAGTRPLDEFEVKATEALFKGETIVARETEDSLRAVGAIRASTKCLECHSVDSGAMLGAFTYQFKRN